ncbi:MAG: iron-sulfur cluster insertion protein ErpA [Alphaproteobacteria bacterium GM7ARS4]|nr:iron-sulfur cluster insertion protein ErpA [Alphaproteobacteria bacterium GM7ARS4]
MTDGTGVTLTEKAAQRITDIARKKNKGDAMLRVSVQGGGCQGFSYVFSFDSAQRENDTLFSQHNAKLVIDRDSFALLQGARIDFVQDLMGARFSIDNPQASSSCGCGNSFSL